MKFIVVDIQGFFNPPHFVPKEIAITDGKRCEHFIVKPSKPFRFLNEEEIKQVKFLEKYHHGISYSAGNIEIAEVAEKVKSILFDGVDVVYVKGHQKVAFLKGLLEDDSYLQESVQIKNLEDALMTSSPPIIFKQQPYCFSHKLMTTNCICAVRNCWTLYNYLFNLLP